MKMDIDVGSIISGQISQMAQSNSSQLGFPALITTLYIARGVIPDSLTFESLSPTFNLAYIRKNCWSSDDPMITFPGTCKTRAWGPSSSPTSTSSYPSSTHSANRPLRSELRRLSANAAEPSPWLMPGDAEHTRPGSASAHHQYGGYYGPGDLARNPAFTCGGR